MTKVASVSLSFVFCAGILTVTPGFGQNPAADQPAAPAHDSRIGPLIESLNQAKTIRETALSPDGKFIVWSVGGRGGSGISLAPLDNPSAAKRLTGCGGGEKGMESNAVFSPDSRQVAFFSDCTADHKMAIFVADPAGSAAPHQLVELNGLAKEMQWSPDGKQLSFLYVEGATRPSGALAAEKLPSGVIGVEGLEVQRVAAVDAASGQLTQITPPKLHVFEFDWSPDSKKLAYVAAPPPGENNWWVAKLYTQPVDGEPTAILDPPTVAGSLHGLQIAVPRWSQDGQQIAFIGGLMSDQGSTGGDIYVMPATGGEPQDVTPDRAASPAWFVWLDDKQIGVSEIKGGSSHLFVYDITNHAGDRRIQPHPAGLGGGRRAIDERGDVEHQQHCADPVVLRQPSGSLGRRFDEPASDHACQRRRKAAVG